MQIYNRQEVKEKRQSLRRGRPPAEVILWQRLRGEQIAGYKFRRQFSIGAYIVDFYCPRARLVIEIDGPTHEGEEVEIYDTNRQAYIESLGIRVLRFRNEQVYNKRSGLVSDPNRKDEPKFILDLIAKVATVSLETQKLIGDLPAILSVSV